MTTAVGAYATAALLKARINISDTTDDTVLGQVCDEINAYIEGPEACGRVIAPIASATYTFDGDDSAVLYYRNGFRVVSLLEIAFYTTGPYLTIPATDYFLRPSITDRPNAWPATEIRLTNFPTVISYYPRGYDTVRVTATTGFAAIPDDITGVALTAATRAWHAVESGQSDVVGTSDMGQPLISRFFSQRDRDTLRSYSVNMPG